MIVHEYKKSTLHIMKKESKNCGHVRNANRFNFSEDDMMSESSADESSYSTKREKESP